MSFAEELRATAVASGLRYGHPTPTLSEWWAKWRDDHLEEIKTRAMSRAKKGMKEIRNIEIPLDHPTKIWQGTGLIYTEKVKEELQKELGVEVRVGCFFSGYLEFCDPEGYYLRISLFW
jgi:hypothetical protein